MTLLARCDDVTEAQQVALFTAGLGGTLGIDVEMQRPTTLEDAMNLAATLGSDSKSTSSRAPPRVPPAPRQLPQAPKPAPPSPAAAADSGVAPPNGRFRRLSPEEMDDRRSKGLCFNCPEKYSREHNKVCKGRGVYMIELMDEEPPVDGFMEDASDDELDATISLNTLTGIDDADLMQLATTIAGKEVTALVDSGSTHSFMATATAVRLGLSPQPTPGIRVKVANGDALASSGVGTL